MPMSRRYSASSRSPRRVTSRSTEVTVPPSARRRLATIFSTILFRRCSGPHEPVQAAARNVQAHAEQHAVGRTISRPLEADHRAFSVTLRLVPETPESNPPTSRSSSRRAARSRAPWRHRSTRLASQATPESGPTQVTRSRGAGAAAAGVRRRRRCRARDRARRQRRAARTSASRDRRLRSAVTDEHRGARISAEARPCRADRRTAPRGARSRTTPRRRRRAARSSSLAVPAINRACSAMRLGTSAFVSSASSNRLARIAGGIASAVRTLTARAASSRDTSTRKWSADEGSRDFSDAIPRLSSSATT